MWPFWEHAIAPLLDAADARRVVEVGSEQGRTTRLLLERAARVGGVVEAIDPEPRFDAGRWELEHSGRFRFHRDRSVNVLGRLGELDAALIDGDHNWHTVHAELGLLAGRARADRAPMPLVIAHDVGWPYGRRDMYYDPGSLPKEARHDAARAGVLPGRARLGAPGVNASNWNATREGGPRNGVLTAIEDFSAEAGEGAALVMVPGWHGLAALATAARLETSPSLRLAMEHLESAEFLREQLERIERARVLLAMRSPREAVVREQRAVRDYGLLDEPETSD